MLVKILGNFPNVLKPKTCFDFQRYTVADRYTVFIGYTLTTCFWKCLNRFCKDRHYSNSKNTIRYNAVVFCECSRTVAYGRLNIILKTDIWMFEKMYLKTVIQIPIFVIKVVAWCLLNQLSIVHVFMHISHCRFRLVRFSNLFNSTIVFMKSGRVLFYSTHSTISVGNILRFVQYISKNQYVKLDGVCFWSLDCFLKYILKQFRWWLSQMMAFVIRTWINTYGFGAFDWMCTVQHKRFIKHDKYYTCMFYNFAEKIHMNTHTYFSYAFCTDMLAFSYTVVHSTYRHCKS